MPTRVHDVTDLDEGFWTQMVAGFSQALSPWTMVADDHKYQATVDRIAALGASTVASCHSPVIRRSHIDRALQATRIAPSIDAPPLPDQSVLDQIQLSMM